VAHIQNRVWYIDASDIFPREFSKFNVVILHFSVFLAKCRQSSAPIVSKSVQYWPWISWTEHKTNDEVLQLAAK